MSPFMRRFGISILANTGFDPRVLWAAARGIVPFMRDYWQFTKAVKLSNSKARTYLAPILADRFLAAGSFPRHYFMQDLWAARRIYELMPIHHVDVGSRIDGFVAHILPFCKVTVLDVRPLPNAGIANLSFRQADLMQLDKALIGTCDTLSCLHAIEHFGLGRYGDSIDALGHIKGLKALASMLKPNGRLIISVPISTSPRIEFNAQRVFAPNDVPMHLARERLLLSKFDYLDDNDTLIAGQPPSEIIRLNYGCGLYEFVAT